MTVYDIAGTMRDRATGRPAPFYGVISTGGPVVILSAPVNLAVAKPQFSSPAFLSGIGGYAEYAVDLTTNSPQVTMPKLKHVIKLVGRTLTIGRPIIDAGALGSTGIKQLIVVNLTAARPIINALPQLTVIHASDTIKPSIPTNLMAYLQ